MLLLLFLVILPSTRAFIDCSMACHQCRYEMRDHHIKEVYCAMCRECRERRRERRAMMQEVLRDKEYGWDPQEVQEPPPGCPTPPDCDSSIEVLHNDVTTEATTCLPVTTARTCPPIIPCRDRKKMTEKVTTTTTTTPVPPVSPAYMPCVPCMPMCPCPPQQQAVEPRAAPTIAPTTTRRDFFYLYIGFPKGALNKTED